MGGMRIGINFDNTIAGYDRLFGTLAVETGLIAAPPSGGELAWQRLQALAFGPRIGEAELIDGVVGFMTACRRRGVPLFIVSHKSRHAAQDPGGTDLRLAALDWMTEHGFFGDDGLGPSRRNVFFEPTRRDKVARIAALGLTHFVDDLPEVFEEVGFPYGVDAILFRPAPGCRTPWTTCENWQRISEYVLGRCH